MRRTTLLLIAVVLMGCLAGCSKPRLELSVASQPNVNPDDSGRPSPVIMKMYELTTDTPFNQGDFIALFNNPVQTLGANLVAADELVFIPGEARTVVYQLHERTKFVGILLGFRQMERAIWRTIKPANPEDKSRLCLELSDTSVRMIDDETAKDWDAVETVRRFQQRVAQPVSLGTPGYKQPEQPQQGAEQGMPPQQSQQGGYVMPSARRM